MPLKVVIITPDRTVQRIDEAVHVLLPGVDGQLGILPGHIPMVASLRVGQIQVDCPGENVRLFTSSGFAEILSDRVLVLSGAAEKAEEIDVGRARRALERAREALTDAEKAQEILLKAAILRARTRLHVAGADT